MKRVGHPVPARAIAVLPGADRPDRLVGDRQTFVVHRQCRDRTDLPAQHVLLLPLSRSSSRSPTQAITARPGVERVRRSPGGRLVGFAEVGVAVQNGPRACPPLRARRASRVRPRR